MVLEIIKNRWSPYSFSGKPVENYKLKAILEAAGYAPSSMNEQPWVFIMTTREEPDMFSRVIDILDDGNRVWAKNAYALIVSLSRMRYLYKDRSNRYAFYDTGMAVSNMLLQATSMNLYIHQMGGFSAEKARQHFRLGEGIEPIAVMAVGYIGEGTGLSEELLERDKKRRPRKNISEYAFRNDLNSPAF